MLAARRLGDWAIATRLTVWVTLAVLPLDLLVFIQARFLPYQDPTVTWLHRAALLGDLALLWWLWPRSRSLIRWRALPKMLLGALLSALLVHASAQVLTLPG